jgi:hypothetical protein
MNEGAGRRAAHKCVDIHDFRLLHAISSWAFLYSTSQLYDIQGVEFLCELDGQLLNEELVTALATMTARIVL